jgi:hypothetical protein
VLKMYQCPKYETCDKSDCPRKEEHEKHALCEELTSCGVSCQLVKDKKDEPNP